MGPDDFPMGDIKHLLGEDQTHNLNRDDILYGTYIFSIFDEENWEQLTIKCHLVRFFIPSLL